MSVDTLGSMALLAQSPQIMFMTVCPSYIRAAIVRVTLTNKGNDAYKPELYPNYITVERRIERNSSRNTYRLLAGDPDHQDRLKLVTDKKSELDIILDRFNIQVGNQLIGRGKGRCHASTPWPVG